MSNIIKKDDSPPSTGLSLSKGKLKSTSSPFQNRVNQAKATQVDAVSMPNRLCLMLDRSSSMASPADYSKSGIANKPKIELLKDAINNFVNRCDFANTSLAVATFPASLELDLTTIPIVVLTNVTLINASGSTPMRQCVASCLEKIPMTRGIIVSDGEATDWNARWYDGELDEEKTKDAGDVTIEAYKKASIPIDCVHIGDSTSGEELLRRIAKETGGLYLKFTDVNAFSSAFSYLTPGFRAMLTDGRLSSSEIGAKEILR